MGGDSFLLKDEQFEPLGTDSPSPRQTRAQPVCQRNYLYRYPAANSKPSNIGAVIGRLGVN